MSTSQSIDGTKRKRTRLVRPYPVHRLEEALVVANTIQDANAGLPFGRADLAQAMGTTPASSGFTMKLNSSARYGLTLGGYADKSIALTPRGEAVAAPSDGDERARALVDAALEPEVFMRFYRALDGRRIPEDTYARNMLQRELAVSPDLSAECLGVIKANAVFVGIGAESDGALFVDLGRARLEKPDTLASDPRPGPAGRPGANSIFIGHVAAGPIVDFIARTLNRLGIDAAVHETSEEGAPIDEEMSRRMRECTAAILVHRDTEQGQGRSGTNTFDYLIGAASVLYGDRIVLLRESGPGLHGTSGLRTVEFEPDQLGELAVASLAELYAAGVLGIRVLA